MRATRGMCGRFGKRAAARLGRFAQVIREAT
jgi:hypothetical protein